MKILITGGGTTEKIDEMRTISNLSSGGTAIKMAESCLENHEVTLMLAKNIKYKNDRLTIVRFDDSESLLLNFKSLTAMNYDIIIQAAAISDYRVSQIKVNNEPVSFSKIPSGLDDLTIEFKKNPKIINKIKTLYPNTFLVGFKLTSDMCFLDIEKNVARVLKASKADLVVQNDLAERRSGLEHFTLYEKNLKHQKITSIAALAEKIEEKYLQAHLKEVQNDSLS